MLGLPILGVLMKKSYRMFRRSCPGRDVPVKYPE